MAQPISPDGCRNPGVNMAKISLHIPRHRPRITPAGRLLIALVAFWGAIACAVMVW